MAIGDPLPFVPVPDHDGASEEMTNALPDEQRVTAPLKRDNSLVNPSAHPAGDLTQPVANPNPLVTTGPPPPPPPNRAYPPTSQQPPVRNPATPPAGMPAPAQQDKTVTPAGWALRGLILLAVAVVSGLLWAAIKPAQEQDPGPQQAAPQTKYPYTQIMQSEGAQGCAAVSTGKIKNYLTTHPCQHLTRALYTTELPGAGKVLVSVVTVRMPDPASAAQLNALATKDATGNVQDLVEGGQGLPPGLPSLERDAGYSSEQQGQLVVLGKSAYFSKPSNTTDPLLKDVTQDALRKGWPQESHPN